ncbi:MAG TPA: hypothetical protein VMV10_12630 [Pirellulales bacterium]|nr:hypothetical protein [Pirellulales bacterium]
MTGAAALLAIFHYVPLLPLAVAAMIPGLVRVSDGRCLVHGRFFDELTGGAHPMPGSLLSRQIALPASAAKR